MAVTFFGEITELDSRAIWYSDEEDEFDEESVDQIRPVKNETKSVQLDELCNIRESILLNFLSVSYDPSMVFKTCIISLSSSDKFKNFNSKSLPVLGFLEPSLAKLFAFKLPDQGNNDYLLWIMLDSNHRYVCGQQVGFFVEVLRDILRKQFHLFSPGLAQTQLIILSKQYSNSEHLEYLANYNMIENLPFSGLPLRPPSLIENRFESCLVEQLTVAMQPTVIVCLPNPKNCWFDVEKNWPLLPTKLITDHRLHDDNLDKTLIFT